MAVTTDAGVTDEVALLAAYLDGDQRAFQQLVERHQQRVHAICYRYFRDRQDAEDATQETFVALARNAARFLGDARLSTWLHRVALNVCHDMARHRARRPLSAQQDETDIAEPIDLFAYRETELDLHDALAQLDDPSRSALVLIAIEDRSYAEAAAMTGVSVPAMKSRVHRARARLTEILEVAA